MTETTERTVTAVVSAEQVMAVIRNVLAFDKVDDVDKLALVAIIAHTDPETGECALPPGDVNALNAAIGRVL